MNKDEQRNNELLFMNITLQARLDIRDFFLENTVREIYENVGQVLSVVRMQLAVLDSGFDVKSVTTAEIGTPGNLVGQSIRDLRALCKSFYPDADILRSEGFFNAFQNTIEILFRNAKASFKIKGAIKDIQDEVKLFVFTMILEILIAIKGIEANCVRLIVYYLEDEVQIIVIYDGKELVLDKQLIVEPSAGRLTLAERAQLIGARIVTKSKAGISRLKLILPLK